MQFLPKLCFDIYGSTPNYKYKYTSFPQSLLLGKIQRTLENQVSKHLLDTSPLNIAFNLVPSQAQWPHSVGIVPEILKMTCDGKRFRVFQIYSGEFLIWNDFSKQKIKQESDHVWTFGMAGWSCHPAHWCINRCTSITHYTTYTGSLFLLQSYLSDELNTVRTSTTRQTLTREGRISALGGDSKEWMLNDAVYSYKFNIT